MGERENKRKREEVRLTSEDRGTATAAVAGGGDGSGRGRWVAREVACEWWCDCASATIARETGEDESHELTRGSALQQLVFVL